MADLDTEGIRTAKKNLDRWFYGSESRFFLPLSGPGLAVAASDERAIRAAAESFITLRFNRLRGQLSLAILLMVLIPAAVYWWEVRHSGGQSGYAGAVAVAVIALGGLAMLAAAWRYERALFDLRDSIALALRERAGDLAALSAAADRRQPDLRRMAVWAYSLAGLFLLWPAGGAAWRHFVPAEGSAWGLAAVGSVVAGVVLGLLAFVAIWTLWLRQGAAASEDGGS